MTLSADKSGPFAFAQGDTRIGMSQWRFEEWRFLGYTISEEEINIYGDFRR